METKKNVSENHVRKGEKESYGDAFGLRDANTRKEKSEKKKIGKREREGKVKQNGKKAVKVT